MDSIIKKESGKPGKTLAVFCGTHGNEKVGIFAVKKALENVEVQRGTVYFVFANEQAIEKNIRYTQKNLNRCFKKDQKGETYEEKRAVELMELLESVDALLDIHSSNNPNTIPFAITDSGQDVVKNMKFEIIATGFDDIEAGATDGYMKRENKVGICVECGYSKESKKNTELAYDSIIQFLQYFNVVDQMRPKNTLTQRTLHVDGVQKITDKNFNIVRSFDDFETIPEGTLIATDDEQEYRTKKERAILFAIAGKKDVGAEAYILGSWVN
jgi:succinylglutamate desuccinylase